MAVREQIEKQIKQEPQANHLVYQYLTATNHEDRWTALDNLVKYCTWVMARRKLYSVPMDREGLLPDVVVFDKKSKRIVGRDREGEQTKWFVEEIIVKWLSPWRLKSPEEIEQKASEGFFQSIVQHVYCRFIDLLRHEGTKKVGHLIERKDPHTGEIVPESPDFETLAVPAFPADESGDREGDEDGASQLPAKAWKPGRKRRGNRRKGPYSGGRPLASQDDVDNRIWFYMHHPDLVDIRHDRTPRAPNPGRLRSALLPRVLAPLDNQPSTSPKQKSFPAPWPPKVLPVVSKPYAALQEVLQDREGKPLPPFYTTAPIRTAELPDSRFELYGPVPRHKEESPSFYQTRVKFSIVYIRPWYDPDAHRPDLPSVLYQDAGVLPLTGRQLSGERKKPEKLDTATWLAELDEHVKRHCSRIPFTKVHAPLKLYRPAEFSRRWCPWCFGSSSRCLESLYRALVCRGWFDPDEYRDFGMGLQPTSTRYFSCRIDEKQTRYGMTYYRAVLKVLAHPVCDCGGCIALGTQLLQARTWEEKHGVWRPAKEPHAYETYVLFCASADAPPLPEDQWADIAEWLCPRRN